MNDLRKYLLTLSCALLVGTALTSCDSDDDKNDSGGTSASVPAYTLNPTKFPKEWMVSEMELSSGWSAEDLSYDTLSFEYDNSNRPIKLHMSDERGSYNSYIEYVYDGNTCTYLMHDDDGDIYHRFKGYFTDSRLTKAEWGQYVVSNVTYENGHLTKGSNGSEPEWDMKGNIININYEYSSIPNKANVDFNTVLIRYFQECWCDDGSECFAYFGWTGVRTANLVKKENKTYDRAINYTYTLDSKKRPTEIVAKGDYADSNGNYYTKILKIKYLAN